MPDADGTADPGTDPVGRMAQVLVLRTPSLPPVQTCRLIYVIVLGTVWSLGLGYFFGEGSLTSDPTIKQLGLIA